MRLQHHLKTLAIYSQALANFSAKPILVSLTSYVRWARLPEECQVEVYRRSTFRKHRISFRLLQSSYDYSKGLDTDVCFTMYEDLQQCAMTPQFGDVKFGGNLPAGTVNVHLR
jgi:hypothetical protein